MIKPLAYFDKLNLKIMKKIFAICGSTRQNSVNLELLKIITTLEKETIELQIFTQIDYLPHYNPDIVIQKKYLSSLQIFGIN